MISSSPCSRLIICKPMQVLPSVIEEALGRMPKDIPVVVLTDDPSWAFGHDSFVISGDNIDMPFINVLHHHRKLYSPGGEHVGHSNVIAPT